MFPINEIVQGDCTRILRQLPDEYVDLVLTDPPYGVRYQDRLGRTIANDDDPSRILDAFTDLYRVLKPAVFISFMKLSSCCCVRRALVSAGATQQQLDSFMNEMKTAGSYDAALLVVMRWVHVS